MPTTISFVRHGTVENPRDLYYGRLPRFGLSVLGRQEAQAAAEMLSGVDLCAIFSSPMLRTRQTAQIIASRHPELKVRISQRLNEVHSPYDGRSQQELQSRGWDVYAGTPAPYEQPADVLRRAQAFIAGVLRACPGRHSLAVTHGDLILFLSCWAQRLPLNREGEEFRYPARGSITTLTWDGSDLQSVAYAYREPHLPARPEDD